MCKILVVDDDQKILDTVDNIMRDAFPQHEIITTPTCQEALDNLEEADNIDVILFNSLGDDDPDGLEFARRCRENNPFMIMIYMANYLSIEEQIVELSDTGVDF